MTTLVVEAKDLSTRFDELIALAEQGTDVVIRSGNTSRAKLVPVTKPFRSLGLHEGKMETTSDFNDPLPDEYWLGKS